MTTPAQIALGCAVATFAVGLLAIEPVTAGEGWREYGPEGERFRFWKEGEKPSELVDSRSLSE